MTPRYTPHLILPDMQPQPVAIAFDAPPIVVDTGLLGMRYLDQKLGYIADRFGGSFAFLGLAGVAALGLSMIWLVMPETRRSAE